MKDRDDVPYVVIERQSGGIASFVWGALIGAGVALLFAPRSGRETRQEIGDSVRRIRDTAEGTVRQVRDTVTGTVDDVRGQITSRIDAARRAIDEGRQAARDTRADLERRVRNTRASFGGTDTDERLAASGPEGLHAETDGPDIDEAGEARL